jgi:hypothetical protein
MKQRTLQLLAVSASLLTAASMFGQPKTAATPAAPAAQPGQQQKLVKIATLPTVEANREFQANVQIVQAQRQNAIELNAAIEKEKDAKKKADMKKELDTLMARLNENNEKMQKAYGFSLTRNYTMEIEKSHIYMFVTDEEAAKIEKQQQQPAADAKKAKK